MNGALFFSGGARRALTAVLPIVHENDVYRWVAGASAVLTSGFTHEKAICMPARMRRAKPQKKRSGSSRAARGLLFKSATGITRFRIAMGKADFRSSSHRSKGRGMVNSMRQFAKNNRWGNRFTRAGAALAGMPHWLRRHQFNKMSLSRRAPGRSLGTMVKMLSAAAQIAGSFVKKDVRTGKRFFSPGGCAMGIMKFLWYSFFVGKRLPLPLVSKVCGVWVGIAWAIGMVWRTSKLASIVLVPYLLWETMVTILKYSVSHPEERRRNGAASK
jgi:hypothetical protein